MKHQQCCGAFTRRDRHKKWCDGQSDSTLGIRRVGTGLWALPGEKKRVQAAGREADAFMDAMYNSVDVYRSTDEIRVVSVNNVLIPYDDYPPGTGFEVHADGRITVEKK